jgi:hypothetical protein
MGIFLSFLCGLVQTPAMAGFASPPPPPENNRIALLGLLVGTSILILFLSGCNHG